ncbi:MAG: RiPP maturation radical SAM C-methyltransferase [Acidobacteriota bacterium]
MDVLFAVMPTCSARRPALGVSLLQARLEERGRHARVTYFNLEHARLIGLELHRLLAGEHRLGVPMPALLGEWLFAEAAFPGQLAPTDDYVATFLEPLPELHPFLPDLLAARARSEELVERAVESIARDRPRVLGFTTTFHQTCASLAVATRVKRLTDPPIIVFGGANCEGPMGQQLLESFDCIDHVISGEADEAFPPLVDAWLEGREPEPAAGVLSRSVARPEEDTTSPVRDLDALPIPDFRDYFDTLARLELSRDDVDARVPFETSRGCWWGAKQHCTFCGLNGQGMGFRSKSPERALDELGRLRSRHGVRRLEAVDNILDLGYLKTVLPRLAEQPLDVELFYETKANLRFEQLALLRAAGITAIQPGIESLSDHVLALMRKGCTTTQNVQLLRWCAELGIEVAWGLIFGFPGETADDYRDMTELLPLLSHLPAPRYGGNIRLDRFSPNFERADELGFTAVEPAAAYSHVFPLEKDELSRLAYFFDSRLADDPGLETEAATLLERLAEWQELARQPAETRPKLDVYPTSTLVLVEDRRPVATRPQHALTGLDARVLVACDEARSVERLVRSLGSSETDLIDSVRRLRDDRLVVELGGRILSLGVVRRRASHHEAQPAVA